MVNGTRNSMEINTSRVKTSIKGHSCSISWQDIMHYAAAINDNNSFYLDDERDNGIVAHPFFPVTLTLPIVENLSDYIDDEYTDDFPYEVLMTMVHYSEYMKIHRLIKPKDELNIRSKFVALLPHRAGTHAIVKLAAQDNTRQPVFTEYIGGMLRGVECVGEEIGEVDLPTVPNYKYQDSPIWKKDIYIDPLRSYIYEGCAKTSLPIHSSKEFAHSVGLPDILLQGVCTLGMAVSEIINEELDSDPSNVTDIACKFTAMVIPDSQVHLNVFKSTKTNDGREIFFEVLNDQGKKAIREGYLKTRQ